MDVWFLMNGFDLSSIPAWGIFAYLVIKLVLDYVRRREESAARERNVASLRKRKSDPRSIVPAPAATPEVIAAVVRDQQERQEVLELLRHTSVDQTKITDAMDRVSAAMERIATTQEQLARAEETQTELMRRHSKRMVETRDAIRGLREDTGRLQAILDS